MFGLGNKEEKDETKNPEYLALVEKWDAFLEKIETRFTESLAPAEEAVLDQLEEGNYDMVSNMTAWSGIKSQLLKLEDKIETTFDEKVGPQMLEYIERWDLIDQDQKGVKLRESFRPRIERFEIILEGKVAQRFYNHAIQFLNEDFYCTQCSGKLEIKKDIFRTHYVGCDYCNTTNTFTPNNKITEIRWVVDNIAKHKALKEWDEKEKAREDCKSIRSPRDEDSKTELANAYDLWEEKEKAFWTTYFTERATYVSDYKDTIVHDVEVKM
ncbi:MAG TPA: hypothetical protein DEO36_08435, partial [Flavobacteriaceae bacterium]|nr:hypothetical protein [Flavobacteriaceae bacterium]